MLLLDSIITLLDSFLYSYTTNYFCNKKKIDKKVVIINFILLTIVNSYSFLEIFSKVWVKHVMSIFLIFLVMSVIYRNNIANAFIPTLVSTFIMICITTIVQNNFSNIFIRIVVSEHSYFYMFFIMCLVRCLSVILQLKYRDVMYKLYEIILDEGTYMLGFLGLLNLWALALNISDNYILGLNNEILKNILTVLFFILLVLAIVYILRISYKSREINRLNLNLKYNNNQLRKVKHDYGAQISYLYGLCLMKRYDDLKDALKDVIDASNYSNNISEQCSKSILNLAVETAVKSKNIKVDLEERADIQKLNIPEMELFRVVSNIIKNAVEAMGDVGALFIKSYQLEDEIIILIQNNGPKIPEETLLNIFTTGFTTKDNKEKSHGYGLSIVKELVEKYDGRISVSSSKELTEFRMVFKFK